jgi:hypothetical protein
LRDTNANTTDVTNTDSDRNRHSYCDGHSDFNRHSDGNGYCNSHRYSNADSDCHSYTNGYRYGYGNCYRDCDSDTDSYCKTFSYSKSEPGTKASADRASAAVIPTTTERGRVAGWEQFSKTVGTDICAFGDLSGIGFGEADPLPPEPVPQKSSKILLYFRRDGMRKIPLLISVRLRYNERNPP